MLRLELGGNASKRCDGLSRRHALHLGATSLLGGLSLPRLLELQAKAASGRQARAKSCIFLFLDRGPEGDSGTVPAHQHERAWDIRHGPASALREDR